MYKRYIKRILDCLLSGLALIILSPLLLVTAILVRVKLGAPVIFTQDRPGRIDSATGKETIFKLYKFRTMTDARDPVTGELLSDEVRLTSFGKKLRATSLDELPELINMFKGDMAIVGPRPLLVKYLPLYSKEEHKRHLVRPGLTGLAQTNGRNAISWDERFGYDLKYVRNITFIGDLSIILATVASVIRKDGITSETSVTMEEFKGHSKREK